MPPRCKLTKIKRRSPVSWSGFGQVPGVSHFFAVWIHYDRGLLKVGIASDLSSAKNAARVVAYGFSTDTYMSDRTMVALAEFVLDFSAVL